MSRFMGYVLDGPHKGDYELCESPRLRLPVVRKSPLPFNLSDTLPESERIEIAEYGWGGDGWRLVKPVIEPVERFDMSNDKAKSLK